MDWLKQIAPTIATALGGPLAGMAVSAISKAIGVDEAKVGDLIANNKLTADQIAQVKLAEIELQKQAQELLRRHSTQWIWTPSPWLPPSQRAEAQQLPASTGPSLAPFLHF